MPPTHVAVTKKGIRAYKWKRTTLVEYQEIDVTIEIGSLSVARLHLVGISLKVATTACIEQKLQWGE